MRLIAALVGCAALSVFAGAQLVTTYQPPKAGCCLLFQAQRVASALEDWNQLGRYHADDLRLEAGGPVSGRVVFLGDSITDFWKLDVSFPGKPYVNRGISGQTTPQMLVRMFPDVIALHPAAVIILAGTNDIAANTGPETARMVEDNFRAMTELAQAHGIEVILCSLTPVSDYTAHPQTANRPPADIRELNRWLRSYAAGAHAIYCDYFDATADAQGMFRRGDSNDGLHPNGQGYALMAPVAAACIARALR